MLLHASGNDRHARACPARARSPALRAGARNGGAEPLYSSGGRRGPHRGPRRSPPPARRRPMHPVSPTTLVLTGTVLAAASFVASLGLCARAVRLRFPFGLVEFPGGTR